MYESFSRHLQEAREAKGLSRRELARMARVPLLVVRNLEEGRWSELPEAVYLRWFIERLAKVLDIPPSVWHPLIDELTPRVDLSSVMVRKAGSLGAWSWRRSFALILSIMVVLGGLLWVAMENGVFHKNVAEGLEKGVGRLSSIARREKTRVVSKVTAITSVAKSDTKEAQAALVEIHHLNIRATAPCWVRMELENGSIRDFILRTGESYGVSFTKAVEVKVGNPGGVEIMVDGKTYPLKGDLARPKILRVSPEGVEEITKRRKGS